MERLAQREERLVCLDRELARGRDDERRYCRHAGARGVLAQLYQAGQRRDAEGKRFATVKVLYFSACDGMKACGAPAGLGDADDVATFKRRGPCARLNWGGLLETLEGGAQRSGDVELRKVGNGDDGGDAVGRGDRY